MQDYTWSLPELLGTYRWAIYVKPWPI